MSGAAATHAEGPELLRFARGMSEAPTLEALERVFAARFGRLLGVPMYGFYALEPDSPRIEYNVAVNVSDLFVARYERAMAVDPLLSDSVKTGRSVYNLDLMTEEEWAESDVYRLAYSTHAMRHVGETPIASDGAVLGALHYAASSPARRFTPGDLRVAESVAGLLASAIRRIRAGERTQRELEQLRSALELAGTAVVISDPAVTELRRNAAAIGLLRSASNGDEVLHELLVRPTRHGRCSRRAEVALTDGGTGLLHAHSDRMATGEIVTVLELRRDHARLDDRLLRSLTRRESQVAALVTEGLSDREIADALSLSQYTVSQHVASTYRKLGVDSRVTLTRLLLSRSGPDP